MYQSDYIPLIDGNKRITVDKLICNYSYSDMGEHATDNCAKVLLYGVSGSSETLLHIFELETTSAYSARDYASNASSDIVYAGIEYDYLRGQVVKDSDGMFLGIDDNITSMITVTELMLDGKTIIDQYSDVLIIQIISPIVGEVVGNYVVGVI